MRKTLIPMTRRARSTVKLRYKFDERNSPKKKTKVGGAFISFHRSIRLSLYLSRFLCLYLTNNILWRARSTVKLRYKFDERNS